MVVNKVTTTTINSKDKLLLQLLLLMVATMVSIVDGDNHGDLYIGMCDIGKHHTKYLSITVTFRIQFCGLNG